MINRVILTGRLTSDVELRKTNDGTPYAFFTLAVNRSRSDQTDFVPCVAWRQTAELMAQYLNKGALIGAEGRLDVFTKNENGNYDTRVTVNVSQITFLESRSQAQERNGNTSSNMNSFTPNNNQEMSFANESSFDQSQTTPMNNNATFGSVNESFGKTEEIDASNINIDDIKF